MDGKSFSIEYLCKEFFDNHTNDGRFNYCWLCRYEKVWKNFFAKHQTLNCGIGGDRSLNVLWRAERMHLPPTLRYVVIHCGTNDIDCLEPDEIAVNIIKIGKVFERRCLKANIIIAGLLPRDKFLTNRRINISKVNINLQNYCHLHNFYFVCEQNWTLNNNNIDESLFYQDYLHLIERGNEKLSRSIINSIYSIKRKSHLNHKTNSYTQATSFKLDNKHFPFFNT